MITKLYSKRFNILLLSQVLILFGALLFPVDFFEEYISPLLFLLNLFAGSLLFHLRKRSRKFLQSLLLVIVLVYAVRFFELENKWLIVVEFCTYFTFYLLLTREIIIQVWNDTEINSNTLIGLVSGFINLGFIGFFICMSIELIHPNSFQFPNNGVSLVENLLYYSYITLLTIGYGDISPITPLAQKAAIFIGLIGQVYLVFLTGIMVGKYIK